MNLPTCVYKYAKSRTRSEAKLEAVVDQMSSHACSTLHATFRNLYRTMPKAIMNIATQWIFPGRSNDEAGDPKTNKEASDMRLLGFKSLILLVHSHIRMAGYRKYRTKTTTAVYCNFSLWGGAGQRVKSRNRNLGPPSKLHVYEKRKQFHYRMWKE